MGKRHFKHNPVQTKISSYLSDVRNKPTKPPNKIQQLSGYDKTPLSLGKIPFFKLRKTPHLNALKDELHARNVSTNGTWKVLVERLKENKCDRKNFLPVANVPFDWNESFIEHGLN